MFAFTCVFCILCVCQIPRLHPSLILNNDFTCTNQPFFKLPTCSQDLNKFCPKVVPNFLFKLFDSKSYKLPGTLKTKNRFSNFDVSLKVFWFECKFLRNLLNFNTFFFTSYKQKYESASIKVKTLQIICTPSQKTLGAETNFWILMEIMQTITTKTFR